MHRLHPHPDEPSHHPYGVCSSMVERLTVTQEVVGSSPITRPRAAAGRFTGLARVMPRQRSGAPLPR